MRSASSSHLIISPEYSTRSLAQSVKAITSHQLTPYTQRYRRNGRLIVALLARSRTGSHWFTDSLVASQSADLRGHVNNVRIEPWISRAWFDSADSLKYVASKCMYRINRWPEQRARHCTDGGQVTKNQRKQQHVMPLQPLPPVIGLLSCHHSVPHSATAPQ